MDQAFWHRRWTKNEIAFHEGAPNALLVAHLARLDLRAGARLFLPLCGKTRDIHWLLSQGFQIVGAELSDIAVRALFEDLGVAPKITEAGALVRYAAPNLDILHGDIFALQAATLGAVDAVYDRAALVALPAPMRAPYAAHVMGLTSAAPQMLITFDYDQPAMDGPPFSVPPDEVHTLYGTTYDVALLQSLEVPGGLKGKCAATEKIWHLGTPAKSA